MLRDTALGNALRKVGFVPRQMRLVVALDEFIKAGGTEGELIAAYRARKELHGDGQACTVKHDLVLGAKPVQANGGGAAAGHMSAQADQSGTAAPLPPKADNQGRSFSASGHSAGAPTVREPTPSQIAAVTAMKKASAQSVFDRETTSWGKQWGNVQYLALDNMNEDGDIARAVKAHIGKLSGADRQKTVRELMTPREFAQLINKVRKHAA